MFRIAVCTAVYLLLSGSAQAATIYRTVDENGRVVFTDVPPAPTAKKKVDKIEVEAANIYRDSALKTDETGRELWIVEGADGRDPRMQSEDAAVVSYQSLSIQTPQEDQSVRANSGDLNIRISLTPELHATHRLRVLLDGVERAAGQSSSVQIRNVDRGTHRLVAVVTDERGTELMRSSTRTFHLLRAVAPKPVAPPPAANPNAG